MKINLNQNSKKNSLKLPLNQTASNQENSTQAENQAPQISNESILPPENAIPPQEEVAQTTQNFSMDELHNLNYIPSSSEVAVSPPEGGTSQEDSGGKKTKKNKRKPKQKKDKKEKSVDEKYKTYKKRKIGIYAGAITLIVGLLGLGIFNVFFKHTLTPEEALTVVNKANGVTTVQAWEPSVLGFLQANLTNIIRANSSTTSGQITVSNIAIEKNEQMSSEDIISYFSCDVTAGGTTEREMFILPIRVKDGKISQAGSLYMSMRIPFSDPDGADNSTSAVLAFPGEANSDASASLSPVIDNFLQLAYSGASVSNIYKGSTELKYDGTYEGLVSCSYYPTPNSIGMNCSVAYKVKLPNGITVTNNLMCNVSQISQGSWVINSIM